jgi:translation elongation factor EF-1alpha
VALPPAATTPYCPPDTTPAAAPRSPNTQERFEHIRGQLLPFLKHCGFREDRLQWLPAVGPLAENLVAPPSDPLLSSWWRGPTVVQAIDAFKPRHRSTGARRPRQKR